MSVITVRNFTRVALRKRYGSTTKVEESQKKQEIDYDDCYTIYNDLQEISDHDASSDEQYND